MSLAEAFSLLFDKGGAVMLVLLALSIYSGGIILMKIWQFWRGRVMKFAVTEEVLALVRGGDVPRARERARQINSPLSRVLLTIIDTIQDNSLSPAKRQAEIQRVGNEEIMQLESHLKGLDMAANVAPLLGLLGTVIGIGRAFYSIQAAGARVNPSMLAGGIWEALLTTIGGLIIAIPAMAAYYILDGLIEKFRAQLKDATTRLIAYDSTIATAQKAAPTKSKTATAPLPVPPALPTRVNAAETVAPKPVAKIDVPKTDALSAVASVASTVREGAAPATSIIAKTPVVDVKENRIEAARSAFQAEGWLSPPKLSGEEKLPAVEKTLAPAFSTKPQAEAAKANAKSFAEFDWQNLADALLPQDKPGVATLPATPAQPQVHTQVRVEAVKAAAVTGTASQFELSSAPIGAAASTASAKPGIRSDVPWYEQGYEGAESAPAAQSMAKPSGYPLADAPRSEARYQEPERAYAAPQAMPPAPRAPQPAQPQPPLAAQASPQTVGQQSHWQDYPENAREQAFAPPINAFPTAPIEPPVLEHEFGRYQVYPRNHAQQPSAAPQRVEQIVPQMVQSVAERVSSAIPAPAYAEARPQAPAQPQNIQAGHPQPQPAQAAAPYYMSSQFRGPSAIDDDEEDTNTAYYLRRQPMDA